MKVRAATVSVAGIAALAASVMLAGCGSGSKTASSSTASAASTAASSAESAPSTATDTARQVTLTLPEVPGWTSKPADELQAPTETNYQLASLSSGENYFISVVARILQSGDDMAELTKQAVIQPSKKCQSAGDPVPLTMSGFDGSKGVFNCDSGGSQIVGALAIPQTADRPATFLMILGDTGSSTDAAPVEEAFNLITSEGTIVP